MYAGIPLGEMSATEELRAIEDVPAPTWHADILQAREQRIADSQSHSLGIAEAKAAVRHRIRAGR